MHLLQLMLRNAKSLGCEFFGDLTKALNYE